MVRFRFALLVTVFLFPLAVGADLTRSLAPEELIDQAEIIFMGTLKSQTVEEGRPGRPKILVSQFQVLRKYKGTMQDVVEVRQPARRTPGQDFRPLVGPSFVEKETYVVFRTGQSSWGFSSPVGLSRGVFLVVGGGKNLDQAVLKNPHMKRLLRPQACKTDRMRTAIRSIGRGQAQDQPAQLHVADLEKLVAVHLGGNP